MNRTGKRSMGVVATLGVAGILATACGGSSSGGGSSQVAATGGATTASAMTITTHSGPLGTYLTDGSGRTVYLFTADSATASKCSGACLGIWPPVTTSGAPHGSGDVTSSKLGTLTRSDGKAQVTYAGHPLYYFSPDGGPGATKGEGIDNFGGKWWVVSPAGEKIEQSASTPGYGGGGAPSSSSSSDGWG